MLLVSVMMKPHSLISLRYWKESATGSFLAKTCTDSTTQHQFHAPREARLMAVTLMIVNVTYYYISVLWGSSTVLAPFMSWHHFRTKKETPKVVWMATWLCPAHCCWRAIILAEHSVGVEETRSKPGANPEQKPLKLTQCTHYNCRPWQTRAGCSRRYKLCTVVEFASGKAMLNRHS